MSSVLLASKLYSPVLRPGIVDRPRLTEAVRASDAQIVLVVAPPGFGKTTLLAQLEELDHRPFAWVSLDRRDNDPRVFWQYLVAAIRRIEPDFGGEAELALGSPGGAALDAVIPRIINELDSTNHEIVLVLDDLHTVTSTACHESIALLIERGPANAQLVLSSRSDPPHALGRVRASGGLFEIRAGDLAFTKAETIALFTDAFGPHFALGAIEAVHRRTEGWPAVLYLALLSVRGASDPESTLGTFGGSNRHVVDYLTEVVLASQTDEHRSFFLETSILGRMSAPVCDSVTRRTDSSAVLAEIERANLFLVSLDDHREWYRYHHLFAELLRDELQRRDAGLQLELHRRAAEWYESAGYIDEAIDHAIMAGDLDTAATQVATHWITYYDTGRLATLTGWLEAFPRDILIADARLCIIEAWARAVVGGAAEAKLALTAAREAAYESELPDGSGTSAEAITLARSTFLWSDVGAMLTAARSAYETETRRRSAWRPLAAMNLGWALIMAGATEEATPPLEQAIALESHHKQWVVAGAARCLLAETCLTTGDLAQADRLIGEALELARTHGFMDLPHVGYYRVILGALHARQGELEDADYELGLGLKQMVDGHWEPLMIAKALLERALVRRSLGALNEARAMLAEARANVERAADPGVLVQRIEEVTRKLRPAQTRAAADDGLTARELDVLQLLADGFTKREVAARLFLSYSTIHSHTKSIYRKLDGNSRGEVLERARELGLVGPE